MKSSDEGSTEPEELARRIIEDSINEPIDHEQTKTLPPWFDEQKFRRGQTYFNDNFFALMVSKLSGLLVVLSVPSILKVLIMTGKSSEPVTAFKRYLDTILHMLKWYKGIIKDSKSSLHKSLLEVRGKHCAASKSAESKQFDQINQQDMALTQFGFMGFGLICKDELGIHGSTEDVEGYIHFWRTIGYLVGIKDRYNLCNNSNIESTKTCCQIICDKMFKRYMENPHEDFSNMSIALLSGMKPFVPSMDSEGFLLFTKKLCGINVDETKSKLNSYGRFMFEFQVFIHNVILNNFILRIIFKPILNFNMWFAVYLCEHYTPTLSGLHFGKQS